MSITLTHRTCFSNYLYKYNTTFEHLGQILHHLYTGNYDLKDLPLKYVLYIFLIHFYFFLPADDLTYTVNIYCLKG